MCTAVADPYRAEWDASSTPSRYTGPDVFPKLLSKSTVVSSPWRVHVLVPLRRQTTPFGATAVAPCSACASSMVTPSSGGTGSVPARTQSTAVPLRRQAMPSSPYGGRISA
jgi:hypothetical protein